MSDFAAAHRLVLDLHRELRTDDAVAQRIGLSKATVVRLRTGQQLEVRPSSARRIAVRLGIDAAYFWQEGEAKSWREFRRDIDAPTGDGEQARPQRLRGSPRIVRIAEAATKAARDPEWQPDHWRWQVLADSVLRALEELRVEPNLAVLRDIQRGKLADGSIDEQQAKEAFLQAAAMMRALADHNAFK